MGSMSDRKLEEKTMLDELIEAWEQWVEAKRAMGWYAHPFASCLDDLMAIARLKEPEAVIAFELYVLNKTGDVLRIQ